MADYRLNAGYVPLESWVHGPEGGGRNIGEACHVYDLFTFLTGAPPRAAYPVSHPDPNHLIRSQLFHDSSGPKPATVGRWA